MKKETNIILLAILVNLVFSITQVVFGLLAKSKAVVVDGIHTSSYLLTNIMALIGDKVSRKPANRKHPYGYGMVQYLTSIFIGLFIIMIGILLVINIINLTITRPNLLVLIVILMVMFCKFFFTRFLFQKSIETNNTIIEALAKETRSDVLSSGVALLLVALTYFAQFSSLFSYMDKIGAIIISGFIFKTGFDVILENVSDIIGEKEVCKEKIKIIKDIFLIDKDVFEVKDIIILKSGPYSKLYAEIKMNGKLSLRIINNRIKHFKTEIRKNDRKIKYIEIYVMPK